MDYTIRTSRTKGGTIRTREVRTERWPWPFWSRRRRARAMQAHVAKVEAAYLVCVGEAVEKLRKADAFILVTLDGGGFLATHADRTLRPDDAKHFMSLGAYAVADLANEGRGAWERVPQAERRP